MSTQHLSFTQSKVYPQEPPVSHPCVLPAEDVRWDEGCPTVHPPTGPSSAGLLQLSIKKKAKQRKEQGNKWKGLFLLGTMGAVHGKGPFQSISFAVEIDLRWSETIFQIKAMFQKEKKQKPLKTEIHTQPTKVSFENTEESDSVNNFSLFLFLSG